MGVCPVFVRFEGWLRALDSTRTAATVTIPAWTTWASAFTCATCERSTTSVMCTDFHPVQPGDLVVTVEQVYRVGVVLASVSGPVISVLVRPVQLAIAAR